VIGALAPLRAQATRLRADRRGLALLEFAYGLPILLAIGFSGIEIANLALARSKISQITLSIADNVARVGEANGLATKRIFEADVIDTFEGARLQGQKLQFRERGRAIVSSLQLNAEGGQWIAWQRCYGQKAHPSSFGTAGQGKTGTGFPGMGPSGNRITAFGTNAVIFVEVAYDYRALMQPVAEGLTYFGLRVNNQTLRYRAAYIVRDPRQLGVSTVASASATEDFGLFQNDPPVTRLTC
jgi:hypothetical protein